MPMTMSMPRAVPLPAPHTLTASSFAQAHTRKACQLPSCCGTDVSRTMRCQGLSNGGMGEPQLLPTWAVLHQWPLPFLESMQSIEITFTVQSRDSQGCSSMNESSLITGRTLPAWSAPLYQKEREAAAAMTSLVEKRADEGEQVLQWMPRIFWLMAIAIAYLCTAKHWFWAQEKSMDWTKVSYRPEHPAMPDNNCSTAIRWGSYIYSPSSHISISLAFKYIKRKEQYSTTLTGVDRLLQL